MEEKLIKFGKEARTPSDKILRFIVYFLIMYAIAPYVQIFIQ